jgi:hypothetical protein
VIVKVPQAPPDPLSDAVYAESATKDGKTVALIQSRSINTGAYVVSGRRWNGFTPSIERSHRWHVVPGLFVQDSSGP